MKIVCWPVAYELSVSPSGQIILGSETGRACMEIVKYVHTEERQYIVVASAGKPFDKKFSCILMSQLMSDFLIRCGIPAENVVSLTASTFNTQGEARSIAQYLRDNREIKEIHVFVKWWHAPRAYAWLILYLNKYELFDVVVIMHSCKSDVAPHVIKQEYYFGFLRNALRMFLAKYIF